MSIFGKKDEVQTFQLTERVRELEHRCGELESDLKRIKAEWSDTFDQFNRLASRIARDLNRNRPTVATETPQQLRGVSEGGDQLEIPGTVPVPIAEAPVAPLPGLDRMALVDVLSRRTAART